jgi:hypothetical protein
MSEEKEEPKQEVHVKETKAMRLESEGAIGFKLSFNSTKKLTVPSGTDPMNPATSKATHDMGYEPNDINHFVAIQITRLLIKRVLDADTKYEKKDKMTKKERECFSTTMYTLTSLQGELLKPAWEMVKADYLKSLEEQEQSEAPAE